MSGWKSWCAALGLAGMGWAVGAAPAGTVADRCAVARGDAQNACLALAEGFLAGYQNGLLRGIRSTFVHDAQALQTTNGHEDTYLRYRQVAERSLCLPADLQSATALRIFTDYLHANPDVAQEPFADVMEVALDARFAC